MLRSPMLLESEKPELISQSTLLSWKYSFLGQLREVSKVLTEVSQSALVSVYSFTVILGVILKQVFLYSHHWMDGFILAHFIFIISFFKAGKQMWVFPAVMQCNLILILCCLYPALEMTISECLFSTKKVLSVISFIELVFAWEKQ